MGDSDQNAAHRAALGDYQAGRLTDAEQSFRAAQAEYAAAGNAAMAGEVLNNLGVVYQAQKKWSQATESMEAALVQFEALNDHSRMAQTLGNLGTMLFDRGKVSAADAHLTRAVELYVGLNQRARAAEVRVVLARLRLKQNRWRDALSQYQTALRDLPNPSASQRLARWLLGVLDGLIRRGQ